MELRIEESKWEVILQKKAVLDTASKWYCYWGFIVEFNLQARMTRFWLWTQMQHNYTEL